MKKFSRFLRSMFKIGCIGFGGGSALIPVIEQELIGNEKLDSKENYDKDILVANLTPGALPVELASSLGWRNFGYKGMLLGAIAMAAPGALLTLLLFTCLSNLRAHVGIIVDALTIIICTFIISLIIRYIQKICIQSRNFSTKFFRRAVLVMIFSFLLSCGKNLYKLFEITGKPPIVFSTFRILATAFIAIIIINVIRGWKESHKKSQPKRSAFPISRANTAALAKAILSSLAVWFAFLLVFSIPAILVSLSYGADTMTAYSSYIGRGCLSALMSFGGGDAYLVVADGLFVEPSIISNETFYGDIVSVANILPGSILCKALSAIGYSYGIQITGSTLAGFAYALSGFSASIAVSGGVFAVLYHLYDSLSDLRSMRTISHYIGPIISGLLGTVILALLVQCKNAAIALITLF